MKRALPIAVSALAILYLADDLSVRLNWPVSRVSSLRIQPYYAIHRKDGRVEFDYDVDPETASCVNSLAPHLGLPPCWYSKRHTVRRIDI